jgi:DNA-binding MarR family transcriptional regulator
MSHDPRLFLALERAAHRLRERLEQVCQARLGVSAAQFGALLHLARHDGARAGDLAAALGVQPAAVTGLTDRMVAAGLVKKKPCPDDARVQRLHLTATGRRAAEGGRDLVAAANTALASRFTADELAVVARFLSEIRDLELDPQGAPDE